MAGGRSCFAEAIRLLLAAVLILGEGPAMGAPTLIRPDDLNRLATISDPVFSPDGRRIAYTLTTADTVRDESISQIREVSWAGVASPSITGTTAQAREPRYSGDGRWLYFLAEPAGKGTAGRQIWRRPTSGGSAQCLSHVVGGVFDYDLAPDGRRAVLVAETGSQVGKVPKTPPPIVIDRFFFKEDGRGYLDDRTRQLFILDLASGRVRQLTRGQRDHWHPSWSPDGRWIAYDAKDQGEADRSLDYDVFIQPPDGGEPRRISTAPGADDDPDWGSGPQWSPDSRRIVWLEGAEQKWIYYGTPQLAVADISTGAIIRPARIDRWFYHPRWSADGRSLLALIEQDRDTWLASIDPASGAIRYLTSGARFAEDFAVGAAGHVAVLDGNSSTPAELRALDPSARPLTHHNDWLAGRRLGRTEDLAFASGDVEIHGIMTLPPDYRPGHRYPVILALHGGPVYQFSHEFHLDQQAEAAAGYVVVAINPRGSSGRGFDFARAIYADWGNVDVADIRVGLDHVIALGIADEYRIGAGGWSYGGILTDYLIAREPRIVAAISGAGSGNPLGMYGIDMYAREYTLELGPPWEQQDRWLRLAYPFFHPEAIKAATLFECAGADDNVPCAGAQQMYLALKTLNMPTELVVFPSESHDLAVPSHLVYRLRQNIAWYDRWLVSNK